jgi:RNA polymerase sigma-70 factor (ECF subfamily)
LLSSEKIAQLFHAHFEALHRYAYTIVKDNDTAKDMVQNVYTALWEKRLQLNIATHAERAYLYRSVYNTCLNHLKSSNTQLKHHTAAAKLNDSIDDEDRDDHLWWEEKLKNILDLLPDQCRTVFIKSKAEKLKYTEIAAALNISVKTVEAHMSKALKIIRQAIGVLVLCYCL